MNVPIQTIYLFADSQLLFWSQGDEGPFLQRVRSEISTASPNASYIGASNGDNPQYYSIFEAAMNNIGIRNCRMVSSSFSAEDRSFVEEADLILLAGGDVEVGWNIFEKVGLTQLIIERYYGGALLIGISAGAVQLGLCGLREWDNEESDVIHTFGLIPFMIGVHEEKDEWANLVKLVRLKEPAKGLGIPAGGGLLYHADGSIEPVRNPLYEFAFIDGRIVPGILLPAVNDHDRS